MSKVVTGIVIGLGLLVMLYINQRIDENCVNNGGQVIVRPEIFNSCLMPIKGAGR